MFKPISRLALILVLFLLWNCEKEVKLNLDKQHDETINCILNPDSTINVRITKTEAIDYTGEFIPVIDARVTINDIELLSLKNGFYISTEKPKPGQNYSLNVQTQSGKKYQATSKIPGKPLLSLSYDKTQNSFNLKIKDNVAEKNYYWISAHGGYQTGSQETGYKYNFQSKLPIWTNSIIGDSFNRQEENFISGYKFIYDRIRIDDELHQGKEISIDFRTDIPMNGNGIGRIILVTADENLDRYLKTGLLQRDQKRPSDSPVFLIPISMFSNIENGKGIFGSCTTTEYIFKAN